jgi:hypothetical protein
MNGSKAEWEDPNGKGGIILMPNELAAVWDKV